MCSQPEPPQHNKAVTTHLAETLAESPEFAVLKMTPLYVSNCLVIVFCYCGSSRLFLFTNNNILMLLMLFSSCLYYDVLRRTNEPV